MNFSVREREVLEAVSRCSAVGMNALEQHFEERMPADELEVVVASLRTKGAVVIMPAARSNTVAITSRGVLALQEAPRG